MMFRPCWLLPAIFLASCSGGSDPEESASTFGAPPATASPAVADDQAATSPKPNDEAYSSVDRSDVSEMPTSRAQTVTLDGNVIPFTATARHLIAFDWAAAAAGRSIPTGSMPKPRSSIRPMCGTISRRKPGLSPSSSTVGRALPHKRPTAALGGLYPAASRRGIPEQALFLYRYRHAVPAR